MGTLIAKGLSPFVRGGGNQQSVIGERLLKALKLSNAVLKAELDIFDLIIETEVRWHPYTNGQKGHRQKLR